MIEWWPIERLLSAQELNGELYAYQIVAILLGLENLSGNNDYGIGLYHNWINSRKKRSPFQSTVNLSILARSFELNGFSEKFPLELDSSDNLLKGGTHRTACSIFYNLEKVPVTLIRRTGPTKDSPKYYGINYFLESELFNKQDVRYLTKRWNLVRKKYGLIR
jgi:hypothetical protein